MEERVSGAARSRHRVVRQLLAVDRALLLSINHLDLGPVVDRVMIAISVAMKNGEGWAVVALALIAIEPRRGVKIAVEAFGVLLLTKLTINLPVKHLVDRRRPFDA